MRTRLLLSGIAGLIALSLAACGGGATPAGDGSSAPGGASAEPTTSSAPASGAPAGNPDATVNLGFRLEPTGLDPFTTAGAALEQVAIGNVYESLVARDQDGALLPALATEWEISDDQLTYTFTLREGVTFHDAGRRIERDRPVHLRRVDHRLVHHPGTLRRLLG